MTRVPWAWLPNGLSLTRLALGLALPWVPADWRLGAVAVAALTDLLDGLAARRLRAGSEVGRLLDPLADKVFVVTLVAILVSERAVGPGWAVAVLARDLVVTAAAVVVMAGGRAAGLRRMRPRWPGKWATAAQFALLLDLVVEGHGRGWLVALTAGLSVAAAVDYALAYFLGAQTGSGR
jgi:phosphatidylglycerophosphate synthase